MLASALALIVAMALCILSTQLTLKQNRRSVRGRSSNTDAAGNDSIEVDDAIEVRLLGGAILFF